MSRKNEAGKGDTPRKIDPDIYAVGYRLTFEDLSPDERKRLETLWRTLKAQKEDTK